MTEYNLYDSHICHAKSSETCISHVLFISAIQTAEHDDIMRETGHVSSSLDEQGAVLLKQ
jgi:hypothetical protein